MPRPSPSTAIRGVTRRTVKYANYLPFYHEICNQLPVAPLVVEIGVANGGSLQMWKQVFGPEARVLGVDLNPKIEELAEEAIEVLVADMDSESGWLRLEDYLGGPESVDLLIDDGGHTNTQQILSISRGLRLLKPGGVLVVEDFHASFMSEFGNPYRYSSWRFVLELVSDLQRESPRSDDPVRYHDFVRLIDEVRIGSSIVAIRRSRSLEKQLQEVEFGYDSGLMDHDYRWDSYPMGRVEANGVFRLVPSILRRRLLRQLARSRSKRAYQRALRHSSSRY